MNTQTHGLMGLLVFGGKSKPTAWAGFIGGILPDIPMICACLTGLMQGQSARYIFGDLYFQPRMQYLNGMAHSFILWSLALAIGLLIQRRMAKTGIDDALQFTSPTWPGILIAFSGAGLLHCTVDFLCHREDAHMQFLPISDWRFMSPVSYYDPRHFGTIFGLFEAGLGVLMSALLFRRTSVIWHRALLGLAILTYVLGPIAFMLSFSRHAH